MRPGIRWLAAALFMVAVFALWLALRPGPDDADDGEDDATAVAPARPATPTDGPAAPEPLEPDDGRAAALQGTGDGSYAHTVGSDAAPLEPEVREHARAMLVPGLAIAMDDKDLDHLRQTLTFVHEHRAEHLLTDGDLSALEAAVACLEGAPDAREEARDLLGYGTRTALSENLQRACGLR